MREKIVQIIKKIISLSLVSSLIIGNMFSYVHARDFKLSMIYLLDTIEDIEYASRENEYHSEHENFINDGSDSVGASSASPENVVASLASPSFIEEDEEKSVYADEPEEDDISTESDIEENSDDELEEDEPSTPSGIELSDDEENENASTESEIINNNDDEKDKVGTESDIEEIVSTASEVDDNSISTESIIIELATESVVKDKGTISEEDFGVGPDTELFMRQSVGSNFTLKAVTKKSTRGGMTCVGVMACGEMQTSSLSTNQYMSYECSHPEWHKVEFRVYREVPDPNNPNETEDIYTNIMLTSSPTNRVIYPDYTGYGDYTEPKEYNVQSSVIMANGQLMLDTLYHVTEQATGCTVGEAEDINVGEGYTPPPRPVRLKHKAPQVKNHDIEDNIPNSQFLLYKVKYGDNFNKIAAYYKYDSADELAKDNHMTKNDATQQYMCYEGDVLFIRCDNIKLANNPFENELTPLQLLQFKAYDYLHGYDAAMVEFYGEPINMSTGDFYLEHTDFELPELDKIFKFSRSYNSIGSIIRSDFGYGFNSIVNDRLMVNADGTVMHFAPDGGGETYRTNRDGTYIANKGNNVLVAVKDSSGGSYADDEYDDSGDTEGLEEGDPGYSVGGSNFWQLKYEDGSTALYNGYGTLLSKTDKRGLSYYYNYDNKFRITNISFPSGASIRFNYNSDNLISKMTLPDNTFITYEYDGHKNLIKVTDQENRTTVYKYNDNGVDPKEHLMTSWYDADNIRQVLNTYDSKGRVVKQIDANGNESTLTYENDRTIVIDNEGKERVFMLDEKKRTSGRLFTGSSVGASSDYTKTFTENSKIDTIVDGNGVSIKYTYDERGNVINEEKTDGEYTISRSWTYDENSNKTSETDYNGNTTSYTYDANNNLIKITDANGNSEIMTYDNFSRLTSKKDKRGNITRYTYSGIEPLPETIIDAKGNVTSFTYDTMRRKLSETDARGNTTTYTYDRTGRKLKEIDKRGNETNYTYSSRGTVTSIKDREDNISTFTYDNVGNILSGTDAENNTLTYEYDRNYNKVLEKDPLQQEKRMVYNDKGQVIEEIDALNHSKRYTLDGVGNIIKEVDRNGNEINYRYNNVLNKVIEKIDGNGKATRYNYDNNGNLLKEIKPDNSEISYEYDSLNQLIKTINEEGTETSFTYDPNGNITKKSVGASGNVGASSVSPRTTLYTYDVCNKLVEEKSPNGFVNKCEYDQVGNIIKLTDENNYSIEYTYDANSNITKIKDAEGHTEEYTYNKENKKTSYKDKNGNITRFTYDRAGRVTEKINSLNEKEKLVYDSNDNIIKNILYNADGSIFSETKRTYNALNKVVEEKDAENYTTTYTYDNNENIIALTNKNGDTKTFIYDANNNVTKVTDEMGLITEYEYDDNYNVTKISDNSFVVASTASPTVVASSTSPVEIREYDRVGNLVKVVDALNREEKYEYNAFGEQVKKTDKDNATTLYNYDNNGNLIKVVRPDNQELIYTYDKHNKLIKTKLNDVEYEYTYDKNYNIVKEKNPLGNIKSYTYDNEGNTIEVKDEEGNTTTNEYDPTGRLIKQTDGRNNNVTLKYDRNNNITEVKTAENIINKFEYDKGGRLTEEIDGENHFIKYEYDNIGNILKKTTESNEITTYTYDKHNVMTSMTDALGNIERYDTSLSGKVIKKTQKDGTIYQYNYDRVNRLINTISPNNYKINFEYSLGDDIVKTTDTLGRQANYEYDIMHNLTKKVVGSTVVGNTAGTITVGSDIIRPLTTEWWFYDQRGNVIRHMDRREYLEYFTYDKANNLIEHKDKNENITRYTYDKVGNIKEVREPNGALTKYDYDNNYNRISITNPRGKVTTYAYDRDNRLISETDPNGNTKRYNYNNNNNLKEYTTALGNTQKYVYDTDNNLIKEIDPRNKEKNYTYDKLHRLTKTTSELNNTAIFTYDKVDNVVGVKDPKGTNTVFDYNSIGKVVQERSVDNTIRTYDYDRAGRLISKINKDRTKIAYDYDENDNIIAKYYLDLHNQETDDKVVYSYNGENMRLGMRDKSGLSKTLYDKNGNLIYSSSNNDKDMVKYEYDTNNRLVKMIYPNNIVVTYTYDENGNIKTVTDKDGLKTYYTYDNNDNEVLRTTGNIETVKRYDADNRLIRIQNKHKVLDELIDEYSYRYDSNNNIIEEIKREPYKKKVKTLDMTPLKETDRTVRVTKQNFTYDDENKLIDARVERLGMKGLSEPNVTTYHYEYDANGNRTLVEIKDDGLTLESTVYEYDRLNKMIRSREVTAKGLYIYEYKYDDNGNLIQEDRHRAYETQPVFYTNIRRYEYTKDNKLETVYSGNTLLVAYTYDGDGTITSSLDRDLDFNQNLNINDRSYMNSLTNNQRRLINKINPSDTILYEMTEYVLERNQEYSQVLMERDGAGNLSTLYTYGNQRINSESYPNLSGLYTYDGRGSVSAVIGTLGDYRATYWYDGLGNVKSQIHGFGAFGSGKKYYGYNAESYNPVTGNQNLRNRQVNIRRQRFLTEDTYLGSFTETLSINRYIYGNDNPLKYKDPSGYYACFGNYINSFTNTLLNYKNQALNIYGDINNILLGENVYENLGRYVSLNDTDAIASFVYRNSDIFTEIASAISSTGKVQGFFENQSVVNGIYNLIDWQTGEYDKYSSFKTVLDENGNKIVTTNYDVWHNFGGYTSTYDTIFKTFTDSDYDKINIGNEYTIWTWKGDYLNLGAGGEIGIYKGTGNVVSTTMTEHLGITMSMNITDKNGNEIIDYAPSGEQHWLPGWDPKVQGKTSDTLNMKGTLDFSKTTRPDLYDKLKISYDNERRNKKKNVKSV